MKNLHPQLQKYHEKFNLKNSSPLFDYSETIYRTTKIRLKIKCLLCNTFFEQRIDKHLLKRQPNCNCDKNKKTLIDQSQLIKEFDEKQSKLKELNKIKEKEDYKLKELKRVDKIKNKIEKDKLHFKSLLKTIIKTKSQKNINYDNATIERIKGKLIIIRLECLLCSNSFNQIKYSHVKGMNGCDKCNSNWGGSYHNYNTYKNRPTMLYLLK